MTFAILRTAKLTTKGSIAGSGKHCFREQDTPNADPARTPLNRSLVGPSTTAGLIEAINARLATVTHKADKPVLAIEYLIAMSPEAKIAKDPQAAEAYFRDAVSWLQDLYGKDNVVAAYAHHDETTPHLSAYVVPLVEKGGKTRKRSVADGKNPDGSQRRKIIEQTVGAQVWLSAAHYVGSRKKLSDMQTSFAKRVGQPHGLKRGLEGSRAHHTSVRSFYRGLAAPVAAGAEAALGKFARAAELRRRQMKEQLAQREAALAAAEQRLEEVKGSAEAEIAELRTQLEDARQASRDLVDWMVEVMDRCWTAAEAGVDALRGVLLDAYSRLGYHHPEDQDDDDQGGPGAAYEP